MAGGSRAPYIIICQGRIDLLVAKNGMERILAASRAAAALVTYYGDKLTDQDTFPISGLQHDMMEEMDGGLKGERADMMVDEMFALLDALEDKMESSGA